MIVEAFLRWAETAKASERAKAARALALAYLQDRLHDDQRETALAAMCYIANDPSPKVRKELAIALARSSKAPKHLLLSLAKDQAEIAAHILLNATQFADDDFIEILAAGSVETQALICARDDLSAGLCAAICEIADCPAIIVLLENRFVSITRQALSRIAERFGDVSDIRGLLLQRDGLGALGRQMILQDAADALKADETISALLGSNRIVNIVEDAVDNEILSLIERADSADLPDLVAGLISRDQLTEILLIKACFLRLDEFVSAALIILSGEDAQRIRKVFASARFNTLEHVLKRAGLTIAARQILIEMMQFWHRDQFSNSEKLIRHLRTVTKDNEAQAGKRLVLIGQLEQLLHWRAFDNAQNQIFILQKHAA